VVTQNQICRLDNALKVGLNQVAAVIMTMFLLHNVFTCYRGQNQTSLYFNVRPPPLHVYLGYADMTEENCTSTTPFSFPGKLPTHARDAVKSRSHKNKDPIKMQPSPIPAPTFDTSILPVMDASLPPVEGAFHSALSQQSTVPAETLTKIPSRLRLSVVGRGIYNKANCCYQNALMQALAYCPSVIESCVRRVPMPHCNTETNCVGCILEQHLLDIRGEARTPIDPPFATPVMFAKFQTNHRNFQLSNNQCIDEMHDIIQQHVSHCPNKSGGWLRDLCEFAATEMVGCLESCFCGSEKHGVQYTNLNIHARGWGVDKAIEAACKYESKEHFCNKCVRPLSHQVILTSLPTLLVVKPRYLVALGVLEDGGLVISEELIFPRQCAPTVDCDCSIIKYRLVAAVGHKSSPAHFVAAVCAERQWVLKDDTLKQKCDFSYVMQRNVLGRPVILFYERCRDNDECLVRRYVEQVHVAPVATEKKRKRDDVATVEELKPEDR
jgi:hypothetical protein